MNGVICIFEKGTEEYKKLEAVAAMLTAFSPNKRRYYVGETYFDYGQDWKWTTVLCEGGEWGAYQALYPAQQEKIIFFAESAKDLAEVVESVFADKFCPDKKKGGAT